MLSRCYKIILEKYTGIIRIFKGKGNSKSVSDPIEEKPRQQETLEKIAAVISKVILYALIPPYIAIIFAIGIVSIIFYGTYYGLLFAFRGLSNFVVFIKKEVIILWNRFKHGLIFIGRITAKTIKRIPRRGKVFKKIITILTKGLLFLFIPPLFVFLLIIILLSKIFPYFYLWIAYGITALRTILAVIGENSRDDSNEVDEVIEFTGFEYDSKQDIFYSDMNAWQRKFGYCRLYDEAAAPWGMIVDCEPIYFEYNRKNWLIEFWKGQYDLTIGCEIGVYATEGPSLEIPGLFNGTFFNSISNEELLQMSFSLRKNNKTLFTREDEHWWLTGFKLGEFTKPSELSMKITITLQDEIMRNEFVKGLKRAGYLNNELVIHGKTVSFIFTKPKTPKPFTRTKFTDWFIQKKNKYLCNKFQKIIGTSINLEDKLLAIKQKSPRMYKKVTNIGRNIKFYNKFKKVNNRFK